MSSVHIQQSTFKPEESATLSPDIRLYNGRPLIGANIVGNSVYKDFKRDVGNVKGLFKKFDPEISGALNYENFIEDVCAFFTPKDKSAVAKDDQLILAEFLKADGPPLNSEVIKDALKNKGIIKSTDDRYSTEDLQKLIDGMSLDPRILYFIFYGYGQRFQAGLLYHTCITVTSFDASNTLSVLTMGEGRSWVFEHDGNDVVITMKNQIPSIASGAKIYMADTPGAVTQTVRLGVTPNGKNQTLKNEKIDVSLGTYQDPVSKKPMTFNYDPKFDELMQALRKCCKDIRHAFSGVDDKDFNYALYINSEGNLSLAATGMVGRDAFIIHFIESLKHRFGNNPDIKKAIDILAKKLNNKEISSAAKIQSLQEFINIPPIVNNILYHKILDKMTDIFEMMEILGVKNIHSFNKKYETPHYDNFLQEIQQYLKNADMGAENNNDLKKRIEEVVLRLKTAELKRQQPGANTSKLLKEQVDALSDLKELLLYYHQANKPATQFSERASTQEEYFAKKTKSPAIIFRTFPETDRRPPDDSPKTKPGASK